MVFLTFQVGLADCLKNTPWFEPLDPETFFPRCYKISNEDQLKAFIGNRPPKSKASKPVSL